MADEASEESAVGGGSIFSNTGSDKSNEYMSYAKQCEKRLNYTRELMSRGSKASSQADYAKATLCFSRALELRVGYFGHRSFECLKAYYKYGRALLDKSLDDAIPTASEEDFDKDDPLTNTESSDASGSNNAEQGSAEGKGEEDEYEFCDYDLFGAGEDESDLDLACKMLNNARAIAEMHSPETIGMVDILSALANLALERGDFETFHSEHKKALSILERLVEADSLRIIRLNCWICNRLGSAKPEVAILHCQNAISACKSRLQRIMNGETLPEPSETSTDSESSQTVQPSFSDELAITIAAEIGTLTSICGQMEKKLEDVQKLIAAPGATNPSQMGTESLIVRTSPRGLNQASTSSASDAIPAKKPSSDSASNKGDGSAS